VPGQIEWSAPLPRGRRAYMLMPAGGHSARRLTERCTDAPGFTLQGLNSGKRALPNSGKAPSMGDVANGED
jgi:hypothetical protein